MSLNTANSFRFGVAWLTLLLVACETPVHMKLVEAEIPTFNCDYPDALIDLAIFRVPNEYAGKGGIPLSVLNVQAVVWEVSGQRRNPRVPITYGKVPDGMTERHSAKPLEEGGYYWVMCEQNGYGGCSGTSFVIQDGKAVRN